MLASVSSHVVQPILKSELEAAGRTLARAFFDDPVWLWLLGGDAERFRERAPRYFAAETAHHVRMASAWTTEGVKGVSLWAPPGAWKFGPLTIAGLAPSALHLFGTRLPKALKTLDEIDREHPKQPHWYLGMLGTDPDHQGKGIGSAVLRPILDRCDREGLPAYLESSKEANIAFYERHGFKLTGQHDFSGGPSVWLMWRDPVPPEL